LREVKFLYVLKDEERCDEKKVHAGNARVGTDANALKIWNFGRAKGGKFH
jgi:hypothetical protein